MHYRSQSHVKAAKVAEIVTQLGFAACGVVCACVCWHDSLCLPWEEMSACCSFEIVR
jgi:hypothetical protein